MKLGDKVSHETLVDYIKAGKLKYQFIAQYNNDDIKERIMAKEVDLSMFPIQRAREAKFNNIKLGYYNSNSKNQ